jgi:DNA-binding beta-propeller fold protein YncE
MSLLHDRATGWLWVTNFESSTVTRLEMSSGRYVDGSFEAATCVTEPAPSDLLLDSRRRRILVTCSSADRVVVLHADTGGELGLAVRAGPMPTAMALDQNLSRIFIRTLDSVVTLDAETLEPIAHSSSREAQLVAGRTLALDARRGHLYTPMDETHIAVTDAAHPAGAGRALVADPIETARVPFMMLFDEGQDAVFVSCVGDRVVQAIDATTGAIVASAPTGGGARGLALSPDGSTLFVTCFEESVVHALDAATLRPVSGETAGSTYRTAMGPRECLAL